MQSHVCDHVELMLAAQFYKPIDWLNRMNQFKEKSLKAVRFCCMRLFLCVLLLHANLLGRSFIYVYICSWLSRFALPLTYKSDFTEK